MTGNGPAVASPLADGDAVTELMLPPATVGVSVQVVSSGVVLSGAVTSKLMVPLCPATKTELDKVRTTL
jgi:hypothetical protein